MTENDKKQKPILSVIKLYNQYIKTKYLKILIISFILMTLIAILTSSVAYLVKPIINKIFINKNRNQLYVISGAFFAIITAKSILTYFQNISIHSMHEYIMKDLRKDMIQKLIRLPLNDIQNMANGKFVTLFMSDVQLIGESLSVIFISAVREFLTIALLVGLVFYQNPYLGCIAFFLFPFVLIPLAKLSRSLRRRYLKTQSFYDILSNKISDIISGIKTIKVYNAEQYEIRSFHRILLQILKVSLSYKRKGSIGSPMTEAVSGISIALVMLYGGNQVINGYSDAGSFFSFITALVMAYKPSKALSGINMRFQTCSMSLNRVFEFLEKSDIENVNAGKMIKFDKPKISFDNVSFGYRFENEQQVKMTNLSLNIPYGSKVAFVGSSGSGKSTILNLIMRLYEIQSGKIAIDDIDIQDISIKSLRSNINYIGQDCFMFDETILHNICYHNTYNISEKDVDYAINLAKVDFLHTMPNGINEYAGYGGTKLSLGQRQRINIARGILKDAPIVILDEATSALDATTEKEIRDMIFKDLKEKTVIMVAHRLSTIVECDTIYVIHDGQIVSSGTHEELLKTSEKYIELWNNY